MVWYRFELYSYKNYQFDKYEELYYFCSSNR